MAFNEQQLKVINSDSDKIVCIASAGSGKTTVLLGRINKLISDGVPADSILVLTFTNAAAQELTDRFRKQNKGNISPKFCTFHAFCYSLISSNLKIRSYMGYKDIPNVGTGEDFIRLWGITRAVCNVKLSDAKLKGKREDVPEKDRFVYDVFWKEYKRQMCAANLISFDIMCYDVAQMFIDNLDIVNQYKEKYQYVMQDEHQDSDPTQQAFVESFTNAKLFCCGDPQQMLYRFRGCTNEIIKGLAENPEYELIKLPHNYRSTRQIVEYSNSIFAKKWKDNPYYIIGESDKNGDPVEFYNAFPKEISDLVPEAVKMQAAVQSGKSVAILCRTNAEVAELRELFNQLNIPIRGKADNSNIIGILKSSIDSEYCVNWLSSLLPNEDYMRFLRISTINPTMCEEQNFIKSFGMKFAKLLNVIYDCRRILSTNDSIFIRISNVIKNLKLSVTINPTDNQFESLDDGIDYLVNAVEESVNYGIYIGTIHSVKGLEYDIVHVVGVDGPSFMTDKNEDEMACYYVACTRAKEHLYIWSELI